MAGVARITLVGNLGRDPETGLTPSGKPNLKFSVAVNRKANGEDVVTWYNVTAWGGLADSLEQLAQAGWLAKGRQVYVDGRLEPREWTDKQGKNRTSLDVAASEVQLIGTKPEAGARPAGSSFSADWEELADNPPF